MADPQFRFREAAYLIGCKFRTLRGWHERGLVKTCGVDTSKAGHPHLIDLQEVILLANLYRMQRLVQEDIGVRWWPGPFLKQLRQERRDTRRLDGMEEA